MGGVGPRVAKIGYENNRLIVISYLLDERFVVGSGYRRVRYIAIRRAGCELVGGRDANKDGEERVKAKWRAWTIALLSSGVAHAQSSVTLCSAIDEGLNYTCCGVLRYHRQARYHGGQLQSQVAPVNLDARLRSEQEHVDLYPGRVSACRECKHGHGVR
jgi:hypothetical protein